MSVIATYNPPSAVVTVSGPINMTNVKLVIDAYRSRKGVPSTLKMHPATFSALVDEIYETRDLRNANTREEMDRMKHSSDATLYNLRVEKDMLAPLKTFYIL